MKPTRSSYVRATLDEATSALQKLLDPRPLVSLVNESGLLRWLTIVNELQLRRITLREITRRAWHENIEPAALAARFSQSDLDSPLQYVMALRVAHLGFGLSRGIAMRELLDETQIDRKNLYALLRRVPLGRGNALELARINNELWLAEQCIIPLIAAIPPRVWTWGALLRRRSALLAS